MKFLNLNILLNISKLHTISCCYKNWLIFYNQISENFVKKQCNISYKMIIYFADKIAIYCFIKLWINQKNKIKLYKLCIINLIIKTRMQCLSKYHSIIDERKCIKMLKNICFHVMSISCKWINNKIKSYILSECQFYKKR